MTLFGSSGNSLFGSSSKTSKSATSTGSHNPMKDYEALEPPSDCISSLKFAPASMGNFIISGSWDNAVRCWEIESSGKIQPKAQQKADAPVLDVCWGEDPVRVFVASCDKQARMWDLQANSLVQVAQHDAPIKTCHWVKTSTYSCLMTGSWDKTVKFWDTRQATPMKTLQMSERVYAADVKGPMAMISCADRNLYCLNLQQEPKEHKKIESPLKYQHRCISIFKDKSQQNPVGFALGCIEGRVAISYIDPQTSRDNFTFKCHRSPNSVSPQQIYSVNDICFHPEHGTLATVGSDGKFSFWNHYDRTKLKGSEQLDISISACDINPQGNLFAYAGSYDWSKGHEYNNSSLKHRILLRSLNDEMKPKKK